MNLGQQPLIFSQLPLIFLFLSIAFIMCEDTPMFGYNWSIELAPCLREVQVERGAGKRF